MAMVKPVPRRKQAERGPRPLDRVKLNDLAITYVARFATSGAKLERYLARKLRERGWEGEDQPDLTAVVGRLCELGYVDDQAYATAKSGSLLRRGYGQRRIDQALGEAGIAAEVRETVKAGEAAERHAALALARKRRFGPFGAALPDRPLREKQLAAMLRAGHRLDSGREIVNSPSPEAAEQWAAGLDEDET